MFLDWIECTFKGDKSVSMDALQNYFVYWTELDAGGMGYDKSALVWEHGRVFWSSTRFDMGIHVGLPATALEASGRDRVSILLDLYKMGGQFTRLDIAADDTSGFLDLDLIQQKTEDDELVCRSRIADQHHRLRGGSGNTLYFGSRESETFFRIYDKAAEQASKGKLYVGHWVRAEMELKGERAHAAAEYVCNNVETWRDTARGWFLAFLDFKERGEDPNKSRWSTCAWWSEFLEDASKKRLFISHTEKTVDDSKNWVVKQVAPTLNMLDSTIGRRELFHIISEASSRLSDRQLDMIASYGQRFGALPKEEENEDSDS